MEYDAVIVYRATIVMQFLNTCSGRPVENTKVKVMRGEETLPTVIKANGFCVILDASEPVLDLTLYVDGFETKSIRVEPTVRWDRPTLVHLIPQVSSRGLQTHLTLEGKLEGITELSGVFLSNYILRYKNYNEKTKKMAVFNRHNKPLSRIQHGLLSMDESFFIPFSAYPQKSVEELLIEDFEGDKSLPVNAPIAPLIVGTIYPDGRYLFRVPDDSSNPIYLLRFVVDGATYFQRMDFHSEEKIKLERGEVL